MTSFWHLQVRGISADELHEPTVDPEEDSGSVDTLQRLPQPNLSAWSTSFCGLSVSAPNKLNLISKSFPLIPPEWTVNRTSIIYTDLSVSGCACCSGAFSDACLRQQSWEERTSFDGQRAREKERKEGSKCLNLTREKQRKKTKENNRNWKRGTSRPVFDESLPRRLLPQDKQMKLPQPRNTLHSADLGMSSFILFYVMIVLHCAPFACAEFKQLKSN